MIKQINVFDLDGVLVDSSHRYRNKPNGSIDIDYWIANHTPKMIALDKVLPTHWRYVDSILNPQIYVIICTVRTPHQMDIDYINNKLGAPDKILMLGQKCKPFTKDYILKRRALQRVFNLRQFQNLPRMLWEDNQLNIDALQDLFSRCIYVQSKQGV